MRGAWAEVGRSSRSTSPSSRRPLPRSPPATACPASPSTGTAPFTSPTRHRVESGTRPAWVEPGPSRPWIHGSGSTAIALEPGGATHLAYAAADGLRHATNRGGAWTVDLVDPLGAYPSMAVDGSGALHLAYGHGAQDQEALRYATGTGGAWRVETASDLRTGTPSITSIGPGFCGSPSPRSTLRIRTSACSPASPAVGPRIGSRRRMPCIRVRCGSTPGTSHTSCIPTCPISSTRSGRRRPGIPNGSQC